MQDYTLTAEMMRENYTDFLPFLTAVSRHLHGDGLFVLLILYIRYRKLIKSFSFPSFACLFCRLHS
jgi:hypothetical protein